MSFSFANLIRSHAETRSDDVAFVDGERRRTFGEVHARSSRAANALLEAGVQPGDRVGVLMKNSIEFFELAFACSKVDAMVVALNWRLAAPELAAILDDAQPSVLVADAESVGLVADRPQDMRTVVLGDEYEGWLAEASEEDPEVPSDPESVMLVLYSSGTTGKPKGIMLTNHNLSHVGIMATDLFRMRPESVHLVVAPLFHIGGAGTGSTLMALGGRTVLLRDASPEQLVATIERERVTHAFFVPAVIQRIVDLAEAEDRDLSSLELVCYGAAPMTEALLRRAIDVLGCDFLHAYGMTETTGTVMALPPEDHATEGPRTRLLRSIGRPLHWLEARVASLDSGEEAAPGEIGEIQVRSEQNMKGYFNQPEATAQTLLEGGWLRTGDGASRDEEGYFFLQDRIKDMIISGGENIYPAEIEDIVLSHPSVTDVAVIGMPSPKWGESPLAVVVRSDDGLDERAVLEHCNGKLARFKQPRRVVFVDSIPRNPTGKALKRVLREQFPLDAPD